MTPRRWSALLVGVVLLAGACASRDEDGENANGTSTTRPEEALEATDVGVTATEIRIAVIADVDNAIRPGLFKIAFDGMQAWEAYVNDRGGIAGRKVVVDFLDSKLSPDEYRNAVIDACKKNFAVVGSIAVFDSAVDELVGCGIPDLPGTTVSTEHEAAANTYPVNPSAPGVVSVGSFRYYLESVEGCCKSGVLIPNQPIARETTIEGLNAAAEVGFEHEYDLEVGGEELNYTPIALEIKNRGLTYVRSGLDYVSTVRLRKEAAIQGVDNVLVWDCTLQCYTPDLLAEGGDAVEDQYVAIPHIPFEEADEVAALQAYLDFADQTGGDVGGFGINAFTAGLLLEEAAARVVKADGPNGLTRAALLREVRGIDDFDADGIFGPRNIGGREPSGCYTLLQVRDGEFTRVHPSEPTELDCGQDNIYQTHVVEPGGR